MIKSFREYLLEAVHQISVDKNPKIGWWLDNNPVTFYHGTHKRNLEFITKNGIVAPTTGSTAGWVSLALEPNTGHGYAAMSGAGGETAFRSAGTKVVTVPHADRITFVIKIPQKDFLKRMAPERGAMQSTKNRLTDRSEYEKLVEKGRMSDSEYYALTEIRYPNVVPVKYIVGYTHLKK